MKTESLGAFVRKMAFVVTLALTGSPGHADCQSQQVWLYGSCGSAYYATGYTVGSGHVMDPLGVQVGDVQDSQNVDGEQPVVDDSGNVIGYVVSD